MNPSSPKKKIRVLHSVGSLNRGGIETWLLNLLRQGTKEMHFDFIVSTPGGTYEEEVKSYGSKIFTYAQTSRVQKRLEAVGLYNAPDMLAEALRGNAYDVFHTHGTEFLGDGVRTAARCDVKVRVAHCHTTGIGRFEGSGEMWLRGIRFRTIDRYRILKYASDILAASTDSGRFLLPDQWAVDPRCRPLYCGVDLKPFENAMNNSSRDAYRRSRAIASDAIVIGHAGSMWPNGVKNHAFLIHLFAVLAERNPRYHLYMAGDGPLRPALQRMVNERHLEHRVTMPGLCDDVPALMVHGFDVHVLPSKYEGFPIVGMEATAAGLFTVCSDSITEDFTARFDRRVTALSLNAPVSAWVEEIESAVEKKITPTEGMAIIRESPFSIQSSLSNLLDVYTQRLNSVE